MMKNRLTARSRTAIAERLKFIIGHSYFVDVRPDARALLQQVGAE
jgi:hypothetical protein